MTQDTSVNAIPRNDKSADRTRRTITITGPASYVTGGDPISLLNDVGLGNLHFINGAVARSHANAGLTCRLVALNRDSVGAPKLQWYDQAFNEIANGVDLSGYRLTIEFVGHD